MPPRKFDQRKSDVSTARFALKDDTTPQDKQHPTETSSSPALPQDHQQQQQQQKRQSAGAESQGSATTPQPAAGPEKKDSKERKDEKDKESKDKEAKDKDSHHKDAVAIEDLTLPKSIITRLAKGVLPANTQIQANAVLALSKSTTVFISYLASHANEHTVNSGKKTILPADVFKALEDTEFEFMKDRLEAEFSKFNAIQTEKRTSYRNKVKAAKADVSTQDAEMTDIGNDTADLAASTLSTAASAGPDESGPRSKKARIDATAAAVAGAGVGAAEGEHDDAETEDEEHVQDEDDDQDSDEDEEDDEDADDQRDPSGDETQDALEERNGPDEHDEALDGDESD